MLFFLRAISLLSCIFLVIGCGGSSNHRHPVGESGSEATADMSTASGSSDDSVVTDNPVDPDAPVAVVVDRVISRNILGKTLRQPAGLAIDRAGGLFLVDAGNQRVIHFDRELSPIAEIGGPGRDPGTFDRPGFVTIDNNLNLFVADGGNQRIDRYDIKLNYVNAVPFVDDSDPLKYGDPSGLAATEYGELWLADRTNNRLVVFDNVGRLDRFVGDFGYSGGQLDSPEKIVRDQDGNFVVCDGGNSRLVIYDDFGNFSHAITSEEFVYPVALAITNKGYWLLDGDTGMIFYLLRDGTVQFVTGPALSGSMEPLRGPTDIALLPDGRLIVSDSGNNRLIVLSVFKEQ